MRLRPSLCSNRAITLHGSLQSAPALILRSKLIIKPDRPPTPTLDSAATDAACLDINSKERGGSSGSLKQTPLSGNWSANKHLDRCFKTRRTKSTFVQAHKWAERRLRAWRTCTLTWRTLGEMIVIKAGVPLRFSYKNVPQDGMELLPLPPLPPPPSDCHEFPQDSPSSRLHAHNIFECQGPLPSLLPRCWGEKKKIAGLLKI